MKWVFCITSGLCLALLFSAKLFEEKVQLPENSQITYKTTLDPQIQKIVEKIFFDELKEKKSLPSDIKLAFVCIDNETGDVLAYIGGLPGAFEDFAVDEERDTGSVLKPLFYLIALDSSAVTSSDMFNDAPVNFPKLDGSTGFYTFDNYRGNYKNKPLSIAEAIASSSNSVMLQVYHRTDPLTLRTKLEELGMPIDNRDNINLLPVSWWTKDLIQIASAYTTLANNGWRVSPRFLLDQPVNKKSIFSLESCLIVQRGMEKVLTEGTGTIAKDLAGVARAKTGSSKDSLAILQTRKITMVLRLGRSDFKSDLNKTGGQLALPLLADVLKTTRKVRPDLVPQW